MSNDKVAATFHGADSCGRGVCAANAGHEFSCSVASGWADGYEWAEAFFQAIAERDRARDTAAALEAELALIQSVYEATLYTSREQQAEIERWKRRYTEITRVGEPS